MIEDLLKISIGKRWAIKKIGTDLYIPMAQEGKATRGASHVEPSNPNDPKTPIRLFKSELAAKIALSAYCKGKWVVTGFSGQSYFGDDHDETIEIQPQENRHKADFEIVEVDLMVEAA